MNKPRYGWAWQYLPVESSPISSVLNKSVGIKGRCSSRYRMSNHDLEDVLTQISRTTKKLAHLRLTPVQTEILKEIVNGNRTVSELTFAIFHSRYTDERFETYHSRTKRAVKNLERRGFIAKRRLLGRDKPYGLTHHGMASIVSIIPEMPGHRVLGRWDLLLFPLTSLVGVAAFATFDPILTNLFSLLLGVTIVRAVGVLRRIS